jgi:predicted dehydrogenase
VIAGVVCNLLPPNTPLTLCSPRGAIALTTWVAEQGLDDRISVAKQWPEAFPSGRTAVIVANAARDHTAAGFWALERGAAVLIEKPLALSLQDVRNLADCASRCGGLLAAAHVLRFARYLTSFARVLPSWEEVRSINIEWTDPAGERRYGEVKQYDSSVPVFMDCLPHAVSVLQSVFGVLPELAGVPTVEAGGARIAVPLLLGERPCRVILQRNGLHRLRRISVETSSGTATLDFSAEPGVIRLGAKEVCGDNSWDKAPRPLASMLAAFLAAAAGGEGDSRLSLDTAFTTFTITDAVMPDYRNSVLSWLADRLISANESDDAVRYALAEILQVEGRLPETELAAREVRLRQLLRDTPPAFWGTAMEEYGLNWNSKMT